MKKIAIITLILNIFCVLAFSLSPEEEYDFLFMDLSNAFINGYKCTFDISTLKSEGKRQFAQGSLYCTKHDCDIAVLGDGFFKVKDSARNEFYTRYGELKVDMEGRLVIQPDEKIYFLDVSALPESYTKITIQRDGSVECDFIRPDNSEGHIVVGKIELYEIVNDGLETDDGLIFKTKTTPKKIREAHIIAGFLETSVVCLDETLLRMLFLLDKMDDEKIKQKETKKYIIQKLLDMDFRRCILFGYFYKENPKLANSAAWKNYARFLERNYE